MSLEELGFEPKTLPAAPKWVGGEVEALNRLVSQTGASAPNDLRRRLAVVLIHLVLPALLLCCLIASPCGLSPYLRFGCLSIHKTVLSQFT